MKKFLEALIGIIFIFIEDFINFCAEKCPNCGTVLEAEYADYLPPYQEHIKKCPECGWRKNNYEDKIDGENEEPP